MSKKRCATLMLFTMLFTLMLSITSFATSLDDLVKGQETTAAPTQQETKPAETKVAETEAEERETTQQKVQETLGSGIDNSFAKELADTANLSHATTQGTAFARQVRFICTVLFQWIAAIASGFYIVCVGLDVLFIIIPPLRKFMANGYVGNPTPDAQQNAMNSNNPMGNGMGMNGMPGQGGYNRYGGGMGMQGGVMGGRGMQQAGQMGMQTAMQNQPAGGRIQWVSNAALNAVAEESSAKKTALVDYFNYVWKTALLSAFILIFASTGVLAKVGAAIALKAADIINGAANKLI